MVVCKEFRLNKVLCFKVYFCRIYEVLVMLLYYFLIFDFVVLNWVKIMVIWLRFVYVSDESKWFILFVEKGIR